MNPKEQKKLNQKLIEAAQNGDLEIVKYLVNQGVNIHANDDEALRDASYNGQLEVVKYLVEQGADIHAKNDYALRYSSENGYLEIVKYLIEQGAYINALNDLAFKWASKEEHLEVIQYFLFDCNMQIKQDAKDWLIKNHQENTLKLIEKRDLIMKTYKNLEKLKSNNSVDNLGKKIKI